MTMNERANRVADELERNAAAWRVAVGRVAGARVIDCGGGVTGSLAAGLAMARACLADLADVAYVPCPLTDVGGPAVQVATDDPVRACLASQYAGSVHDATTALPGPAADTAGHSIGGAVLVAQQLGGRTGTTLLSAAQSAYVDGFRLALLVAAVVAFAGAVVAAIWLPARATDADDAQTVPAAEDDERVPETIAA